MTWLKLAHCIGFTNLSDAQVNNYEESFSKTRSPRDTVESLAKDMLFLKNDLSALKGQMETSSITQEKKGYVEKLEIVKALKKQADLTVNLSTELSQTSELSYFHVRFMVQMAYILSQVSTDVKDVMVRLIDSLKEDDNIRNNNIAWEAIKTLDVALNGTPEEKESLPAWFNVAA